MRAEPTLDALGRWSPFGARISASERVLQQENRSAGNDSELAEISEENELSDLFEKVEGRPR
jgi:hypothetical protein